MTYADLIDPGSKSRIGNGLASKLFTLAGSDYPRAQGLTGIIQRDQKFAAHLLRAVNASAFRDIDEINNLQQAITRLS